MKLLTKALRKELPRLYSQEDVNDPVVHIKFFHPFSSWYWFAVEGEPVLDDDDKEVDFNFFGLVKGTYTELGSFSLNELEGVKIMGLPMERDRFFKPTPLSKVRDDYDAH